MKEKKTKIVLNKITKNPLSILFSLFLIVENINKILTFPSNFHIPLNKASSYSKEFQKLTPYENRMGRVRTNITVISDGINTGDPSNIFIKKTNSEILSSYQSLKYIALNEVPISTSEIDLQYYHTNNTILSTSPFSFFNTRDDSKILGRCDYRISSPILKIENRNCGNFYKTQKFNFITLGISSFEKGLFYFQYNSTSDKMESLKIESEEFKFEENLVNFWIIEQKYLNDDFIVLAKENGGKYVLQILKIKWRDNYSQKIQFDFIAFYDFEIPKGLYFDINKIGFYNNEFFFATRTRGIVVYYQYRGDIIKNGTSINTQNLAQIGEWVEKTSITNFPNEYSEPIKKNDGVSNDENIPLINIPVKDFIILQNTIYVIIENKGLFVIDLKNLQPIENFRYYNKFLYKVEFYNNIYLGNKYIDLFIKNELSTQEFFVELLVDDEYNPLANKVYTSSLSFNYSKSGSFDDFLIFLINPTDKSLIILRKAMFNSIAHQAYTFDLNSQELMNVNFENAEIVSAFDINSRKIKYALKYFNGISLFNLDFQPDNLNCVFFRPGKIELSFLQNSELCNESLDLDIQKSYCVKNILYKFSIIGLPAIDVDIILTGVLIGYFFMVLLIVVFSCFKTNGCRNMRYFKLNKTAFVRERLYYDAGADINLQGNRKKDFISHAIRNDYENRESENENGNIYNNNEREYIKSDSRNYETERENKDKIVLNGNVNDFKYVFPTDNIINEDEEKRENFVVKNDELIKEIKENEGKDKKNDIKKGDFFITNSRNKIFIQQKMSVDVKSISFESRNLEIDNDEVIKNEENINIKEEYDIKNEEKDNEEDNPNSNSQKMAMKNELNL